MWREAGPADQALRRQGSGDRPRAATETDPAGGLVDEAALVLLVWCPQELGDRQRQPVELLTCFGVNRPGEVREEVAVSGGGWAGGVGVAGVGVSDSVAVVGADPGEGGVGGASDSTALSRRSPRRCSTLAAHPATSSTSTSDGPCVTCGNCWATRLPQPSSLLAQIAAGGMAAGTHFPRMLRTMSPILADIP